jgi:site-specific DNA recombinase
VETAQTLEEILMNYEPTPQEYAAVYARKSTQADNNSIESQKSLAMDVIKKKGLLLYKVYFDIETATKYEPIHRVGFKELMHDAMEGKFKTLVVYRRDRLARKAEHLIEIKRFFKKCGIRVIYSNEGEFQPDDSYISNFIENIIMAVDELEPRILSERIESGKLKKRERKEYVSGRNLPFGYTRREIDGITRYVCVPDEIELIGKVFNEFIINPKSKTLKDLINEINDLKTLKGKQLYEQSGDKKHLKPKKFSLINTIKAPVYAGLQFKNNKLRITSEDVFIINDDGKPVIRKELLQSCSNVNKAIDEDIWYKAINKWKSTNIKNTKGRKKEETQLFKNLLYCDSCKEKIWFKNNSFTCKKGCFSISKDMAVNKLLYAVLLRFIDDERFLTVLQNRISQLETKIELLEKEVVICTNKIKKYTVDLIIRNESSEEGIDKIFNKERIIKEELTALKMKRMELLYMKDNIKSLVVTPAIITDLKERQEYLQNMLENLIEKVYINGKDEQISITFKE